MDEDGYRKYEQFVNAPPLLTVKWHDPETEAVGWLVINSLKGRAAGGGTRMHSEATEEECKFLAKTMQIKFRVSGPPIGGAKSVIRFNPQDGRKRDVLRRWFESISPYVHLCYGTGGDFNVNELNEVIPHLSGLNISHPQKGVVVGHFLHDLVVGALRDKGESAEEWGERRKGLEDRCERRLRQLSEGGEGPVKLEGCPEPFKVAQLVTGFGVHKAVEYFYAARGESLAGRRVLIEGFGEVGGSAAYFLARAGAKVVGIVSWSREGGYRWAVNEDGLDVAGLLTARDGNNLPAAHPACRKGEDAAEFWATGADIFVPAANSHLTVPKTLESLRRSGVSVIACAANNPFGPKPYARTQKGWADAASPADGVAELLETMREADRDFAVIPDFIANCGTARMFSYLMWEEREEITVQGIFDAIEQTIREEMSRLLDGFDGRRGLLNRAYSIFIE